MRDQRFKELISSFMSLKSGLVIVSAWNTAVLLFILFHSILEKCSLII